MNIIGRDWMDLTHGERMATLKFAAWLTEKKKKAIQAG